MRTSQIRRMVAKAEKHESQTGNLASLVANYMRLLGKSPEIDAVESFVLFIKRYIEMVPDFLDKLEDAAINSSLTNEIIPVIDLIESYYFEPNDLIRDNLGLYGLMDDSYLAASLIQRISDNYEKHMGKPLIDFDLAKANMIIRDVLGEPIASIIDVSVSTLLKIPAMDTLLGPTIDWEDIEVNTIFGDYKIKEMVDAQMSMLGISI